VCLESVGLNGLEDFGDAREWIEGLCSDLNTHRDVSLCLLEC